MPDRTREPILSPALTAILAGTATLEQSMPATQQPLSDLPFVRQTFGAAVRLWVVEPSGDWAEDNITGRDYADLLLAYIRVNGNLPLLGMVCREIGRVGGAWTGVEAGFFQRIAERSMN